MAELSEADVNRIAEAVVEKAMQDVGIRDIMIGSAMGTGAIPLYGRETRKEPCACCLIDPEGPNAPKNRMCTTKGAIGTLSNREEREWCSEIKIVSDGRCSRARAIREAARECKEKYPTDTEAFFKCYIPAFSQITRGGNPGIVPEIELYRTTRGFEEDAALRTDLETVQGYKLHAVFETPTSAQSAAAELAGQDIRFVKHISTTGLETWEVYAKPPASK